jgi:hypothetical protein
MCREFRGVSAVNSKTSYHGLICCSDNVANVVIQKVLKYENTELFKLVLIISAMSKVHNDNANVNSF